MKKFHQQAHSCNTITQCEHASQPIYQKNEHIAILKQWVGCYTNKWAYQTYTKQIPHTLVNQLRTLQERLVDCPCLAQRIQTIHGLCYLQLPSQILKPKIPVSVQRPHLSQRIQTPGARVPVSPRALSEPIVHVLPLPFRHRRRAALLDEDEVRPVRGERGPRDSPGSGRSTWRCRRGARRGGARGRRRRRGRRC